MIVTTELQPWYWRKLPLRGCTASNIFACLFFADGDCEIATLLESPYPNNTKNPQLARFSICAGTPRIINGVPQLWTPHVGGILPFLELLLKKSTNFYSPSPSLPFTGGWLGWLGYDVAWEIEALPKLKSDTLPFPVAFWYEPDCFAVLDHWEQVLWLAASSTTELDKLENKLEDKLNLELANLSDFTSPIPDSQLPIPKLLTSEADYQASVLQAKEYIKAGDIFQANLSVRFEAETSACGWDIYQALQKINPSPFASYFKTPWGEVVSCSPERLVQVYDNVAQTRPIAGTRKRGKTSEEDWQLAQELLSNSKERAEHIMLVDLERNDLGRVCEWGSVKADELLTIERYSHVMHLVSNVKGILRYNESKEFDHQYGNTTINLIAAMFPGGTITGCPKVRCMEIIEELEPVRRSLFYGSCGYLDWRGNLDLNILIRTLLVAEVNNSLSSLAPWYFPQSDLFHSIQEVNLQSSRINPHYPTLYSVWGQVGAGIVADSNPEKEWYESLHKAQALLAALQQV